MQCKAIRKREHSPSGIPRRKKATTTSDVTYAFSQDISDVVDLEEGSLLLVAALVHRVHGVHVGGLGAGHQERLHGQLGLQLSRQVGAPAGMSFCIEIVFINLMKYTLCKK